MSEHQTELQEPMAWERVEPPYWWEKIQQHVIADRHLPDGTRQHMIRGRVAPGTVVNNAQIIGEADVPDARFSDKVSPLSA